MVWVSFMDFVTWTQVKELALIDQLAEKQLLARYFMPSVNTVIMLVALLTQCSLTRKRINSRKVLAGSLLTKLLELRI